MACKNSCKLCPRLVISTAVNVDGTDLIINLPQRAFLDGECVCVVIAQTIPSTAPVGGDVYFSITGGTERYQLVTRCCRPITICGIRSRMRYKFRIETSATGAVFKMLADPCCSPSYRLPSIDGTAPAATPAPTPASAARSGGKSTTT